MAPTRWWRTFQDEGLNNEVNRALGGNFDLAVALQRLRAAQALTRREASDLLPDLNGFTESSSSFGPGPSQWRAAWGLDAAYQIDIWGQIRSRVDAERLRTEATRADYHAVALSLAAEVSRTWFSLIEAYAQLELLEAQAEVNRDGLKAVEGRFGVGGGGGSPNVLRQRQLIQSTLEQMVIVRSDIEVLEHQLAVLTGQPPQTASYTTGSQLPGLPPLPETGVPSELLMRRPDVRGDYLALAAADRDLSVAVLDQYPRLDLAASLANIAERPETIFRDWFLSMGSQLVGPILDGGQRRAEVARRQAIVCQRFNEYRQTIQIALQEVEDGLARERYQLLRIEKLQVQLELAELASEQLRRQFITGDASYLDILSAIQSQQRLQRTILSARLDLLLIRIGLYLALAGDFDTRPYVISELPSDDPQLPSGLSSEALDATSFPPESSQTPVNGPAEVFELPVPLEERSPKVQTAKEIDISECSRPIKIPTTLAGRAVQRAAVSSHSRGSRRGRLVDLSNRTNSTADQYQAKIGCVG